MIIPITYALIIFFFAMLLNKEEFYWTRFLIKLLGSIFGIWLALYTFNGEYWLTDSPLTLTQLKDNFQLPIALIILGISIMTWIMLIMSIQDEDWKKNDNAKPNE